MKRAALLSVLMLGLIPVGPAFADGRGRTPFDLVREMQLLQDDAVLRSKLSGSDERKRIVEIGAQLMQEPAKVWADPKNARAAVIYVLSGGDTRVLRKLVGLGVSLGVDEGLVKAALAYGERRDDEAVELFEGLDADAIDPSIVGHVNLVHASLIAEKKPAKALALLGMARILATGTIVEEAALRREAILSAQMDKREAFEALSSQYFRRFATSRYAGTFRHQFAHEVVVGDYSVNEKHRADLDKMLEDLGDAEHRKACLAIAEEGITSGNPAMVRFVAQNAARLFKNNPADAMRLRLYEAAALVVTKDVTQGLAALRSIDRSKLDEPERDLLRAALAVGREVTRPPPPRRLVDPERSTGEEAGKDDRSGVAGSKEVARAEEVLTRVDKLLSEAVR